MNKAKQIIAIILCILIVVFSVFLINSSNEDGLYPQKEYSNVLSIWQIDTFTGGKGSRTAFLRSVANEFSKKHPEVLFIVVNHTVESATESIIQGKMPDLISYGACGFSFLEKFTKLKNYKISDGDSGNKNRYAVSWCKGGYFAIKKGNGEKIIIQNSQNTNIFLALKNEQIDVSNAEICNEEYAYTLFLKSKNATLYGNQRNIVRLQKASVEFESTPLTEFNDNFQYLSLMTCDGPKISYLNTFIDYLLSEKVQSKLVELGLFSVTDVKIYKDNEHYAKYENTSVNYTISPFLQLQTIENLKNQSKTSFLTKDYNNDLANYLKQL